MILVTSNEDKLREFRTMGLAIGIERGIDLREVAGTMDEVILYKALDAGAGRVVEDTVLQVDGEEIVDIRWKIGQLSSRGSAPAAWTVSLGHNDGTCIRVYRGVTQGTIRADEAPPDGAFGFDPYFVPDGTFCSLHELGERKRDFSARLAAIRCLRADRPILVREISHIPPWNGTYQG